MLQVARYRLEFEVESAVTLPAYAGSTLRGALGHAFRASVCVTGKPTCEGCPVRTTCAYAAVFEPPAPTEPHALQSFSQIPRPYVIEPPSWGEHGYRPGESLAFHLVLIGRALRHLPLLLHAFDRAFAKGVGRPGSRARLHRAHWCGEQHEQVILAGRDGHLIEHPAAPAAPRFPPTDHVRLHFATPLRLQANGRRATADEYTPRRLLNALVRRTALLAEFHSEAPLPIDFAGLSAAADTLHGDKHLTWRNWSRSSTRQGAKFDLGGVVGTWDLRGGLTPFLPYLHLGQWLHVGKEAVFGMGGYRLEVLA